MRRIDIVFCICLGLLLCITSFLGYQEYQRIVVVEVSNEMLIIGTSEIYQYPIDEEIITDISQHILLPDRSQQSFPFKPEYLE